MTCPKCGSKMEATVELTGGCNCRGDERCYCDSPDCRVEFRCPQFGPKWRDSTNGRRRYTKGKCKQRPIPAPQLADAASIGRWLTEHYNG